jgi:nitrogenase iron protein NifH
MEKLAVYGKGGIGKSVIATTLSAAYAMGGSRVLHMGCDPKADSAVRLMEQRTRIRTILKVLGDDPTAVGTNEILNIGRHGIHCCEAGGPPPGLGCGGRGVARALELLDEMELLDGDAYDVAMFDVLGDVVCGGFAAPLRSRFAEKVMIVASEEPMSLFAANNIARAVVTYHRNGVTLAGIVANLRGKDATAKSIERLAKTINTKVIATIEREPLIMKAEREQKTIVEYAPDCNAAKAITALATYVRDLDTSTIPLPTPLDDDAFFEFMRTEED